MGNTLTHEVIDHYIAGRYRLLEKQGTLSLARELVTKVVFANVWANKKNWDPALPADTDVSKLPYLSSDEKIRLAHMVAVREFYPGKHHGRLFMTRGHMYAKDYFEYYDSLTSSDVRLNQLSRLSLPVASIHRMQFFTPFKIYSSGFRSLTNKVRFLSVVYRDPSEYCADELALLKEKDTNLSNTSVENQYYGAGALRKLPVLQL